MTPEENELINRYVALSGLQKQEYLTANMLRQQIKVYGNPRVFKALKYQMNEIVTELRRIDSSAELDKEFMDLIRYVEELYALLMIEPRD